MKKYLSLLAGLPLFENIDSRDIPSMLSCLQAQKRCYSKDFFIRNEGDPADFIGIVLEGTIQVLQYDFGGNRRIISSFSAGDLFAEAISCAEVPALPFSIQATSECVILFLNEQRILHPCDGGCPFHNRLIRNLLIIVARKNMQLNQKLRCISHKTTAEKLLHFLNEQAKQHRSCEFSIPYDRQALADYLGVERSAMAAEISKLQKQGVLETKRNWFRLHQSENLK